MVPSKSLTSFYYHAIHESNPSKTLQKLTLNTLMQKFFIKKYKSATLALESCIGMRIDQHLHGGNTNFPTCAFDGAGTA